MTAPIVFNKINVNGMESLGGVFIGDIAANGWEIQEKLNQSIGMNFGSFGGAVSAFGNFNYIYDPDVIENPNHQIESQPAFVGRNSI